MDRERIIEIQQFWGVNEIACKGCGSVLLISEVVYEQQGSHVRQECPECEQFLGWAKQSKAYRIFKNVREGLVEIEKIDRGWLKWALAINHTEFRKPDYREAALRRINSKDIEPIPDHRMTEEDKKRAEYLLAIDPLQEEIHALQRARLDMFRETEGLDAVAMAALEKKGRAIGQEIAAISRKRNKMLNWLRDNPA